LVGAGDGRVEKVAQVYVQAGVKAEVMAYCDDMPSLFERASMMLARSGAMTVGEASVVGMPAFFVPLPSAADQHQYFNALSLQDVGAAEIVNQDACNVDLLAEKLKKILFDSEKLQNMSALAKKASILDAGKRQIAVLEDVLGGVKR